MRLLRLLAVSWLAVVLSGCWHDDEDSPTSSLPAPPAPAPTYQVPDSDCPSGWTGLVVTTDSDAEVEYLDDIPACTNASSDTTYLENRTDAVWTLRSTSSNRGTATPITPTLGEVSFAGAVMYPGDGEAILVPDAEVTVDLSPDEVEWVIDLPLSVAWQGHDVVLEEIEAAGETAALAALRRQSQAGAALAACTFALKDYAETVPDLENANAAEVVLDGLGITAASSACRTEAAAVSTVDETGRPVFLTDELERLRSQTAVLEKMDTQLGYGQRAAKVLRLGLKFLQ